jgi:hypothetical protein
MQLSPGRSVLPQFFAPAIHATLLPAGHEKDVTKAPAVHSGAKPGPEIFVSTLTWLCESFFSSSSGQSTHFPNFALPHDAVLPGNVAGPVVPQSQSSNFVPSNSLI